MEGDAWSFGVSATSRSNPQSIAKSHSDLCIDLEEFEGDDELKAEHPCPFCPEDFDLLGLCCHIEEEHPIEANFGACPVCATRVGTNMIGHITTQHANIFKGWHKLKLCKDEPYSTPLSRKELLGEHFQSLPAGLSSAVSTSKMARDPLLSFLYNMPAADKSESIQPDSSTELSLEDENSDEAMTERCPQLNALSEKDQMEKAKRCNFVQGLLLSTILDDSI